MENAWKMHAYANEQLISLRLISSFIRIEFHVKLASFSAELLCSSFFANFFDPQISLWFGLVVSGKALDSAEC